VLYLLREKTDENAFNILIQREFIPAILMYIDTAGSNNIS
jgi:hypothetical protein